MKVNELIKIVPITCVVHFVNYQQADLGIAYGFDEADPEKPPRRTLLDDREVLSILSVSDDYLMVMLRNENDVNGQ